MQAQKFRRWYREQVLALFADVDAILAPATPCTAPAIGQQTFMLDGVELPVRANIGIYTQPISFIGLPVVAVPVPLKPLPIGVQIIAAPWREDVALRVAHALEAKGVVSAPRPAERTEHGDRPAGCARRGDAPSSTATSKRWSPTTSRRSMRLFCDDPRTIRYGGGENLYGHEEITAFRAARSPAGLMRALVDAPSSPPMAATSRSPRRCFTASRVPGKIGRQMQTWVRFRRAGTWSPPMSA